MDFLHECLEPQVSCEKPTVDGFEVLNLVNKEYGTQKLGFMCESFVRTPVDIKVEFPIPIDVAFVELETQLRTRRCKGLSISVRSEDPNHDNIFLGKWFNNGEDKMVLKNFNFNCLLPLPIPIIKKTPDIYIGSLKCRKGHSLKCVKSITIHILAITPTGPPLLKSLHIWGQPSLSISIERRRHFFNKWRKRKETCTIQSPHTSLFYSNGAQDEYSSINIDDNSTSMLGSEGNNIDLTEEIPEEFLDPLTFEIMVVPILLPSGNTIDKITLEKFFANEAVWGRPPSDPFTGVPFRRLRPEPNVHLKARIDRYLVMNQNLETSKCVGRTLALASSNEYKDKNLLQRVENDRNTTTVKETNSSSKSTLMSVSAMPSIQSSKSKRSRQLSESCVVKPTSSVPIISGRHSLVRTLGFALKRTSSTTSRCEPSKKATKLNVCDSEGNLLKPSSIIQGGRNSESFSLDSVIFNSTSASTCSSCGERRQLYSLTCDHIICKNCLTSVEKSVQCSQCQTFIDRTKVTRIHPKSLFS